MLLKLTTKSATELVALMHARAVSPVEVLEAHLRRAEQLNSHLKAIVTLAPDALDQARKAEQSIMRRGDDVPPLTGLPLTVKDTIEVANSRATSGALTRADYVPAHDAPAVARLRRAGAIIWGKTNTSEMALDYSAENPLFGRTLNPHDPARTPGGSSGGCAAAVSACLTPASLGSDLVGSIRIPAHCCGVVGLKPTLGSVQTAGHCPPTTGPFSLGAHLGPLARRVDDLALLYSVLSEGRGATAMRELQSAAVTGPQAQLGGTRVAFYTDDGVAPVTAETRRGVVSAAGALSDAGMSVEEARPPGVNRAPALWLALFTRAVGQVLREEFRDREELAGPAVRALLGRDVETVPDGKALAHYFAAWDERDRLRAELDAWMKERPLLVAPVGAVPAFAHGARRVSVGGRELSTFRAFSYAQTFNVFGLPVVTVPAGRSPEGLPIGVQIVGRAHEEARVVEAARIVEAALGGWQPPPSFVNLPPAPGNSL
ncbi:MAG: amidase [Pyrinomonadaceae bacterium]